jgi:hypothetical protein
VLAGCATIDCLVPTNHLYFSLNGNSTTPDDFTNPAVIRERLAIARGPACAGAATAPPIPAGWLRRRTMSAGLSPGYLRSHLKRSTFPTPEPAAVALDRAAAGADLSVGNHRWFCV